MKHNYLFLLLFSLFIFSACSSDDKEEDIIDIQLSASFNYIYNGVKVPDVGATLYLFKIDEAENGNYIYNNSSKQLEHKSDGYSIQPYIIAKANDLGIVNINVEDNRFYQSVYIGGKQNRNWGTKSFKVQGKPVSITEEYVLIQNRISILGDSYSTFKGYLTPSTNLTWYPAKEPNKNNVIEVEQTWWYQFINETNSILDTNNSVSGSTICSTGYNGDNSERNAFITRMNNLGSPDIIFIFGGTNDNWANSPLGSYKYDNWTKEDLKSFRPAMAYMLDFLTKKHPNARVINIINTDLKYDIIEAQISLCKHYKIEYLQLKNIERESGHPNINGMSSIKNQIMSITYGY